MYQFFVEPDQIDVAGKSVIIRGADVNHIKNVLRMRPGEEVAVSNGIDGREYRCGILALEEDCVRLELRFIKEDGVELPAKIYLFQGLPKADKMELIIQKAVELGAFQVIPVAMKRCVVKLDGIRNGSEAGALRTGRGDGTDETADRKCKAGAADRYFHRSGGRLRSGGDPDRHRGRNTADYAGKEDPSYRDRRIYDYRMADVSVGKLADGRHRVSAFGIF